MQFGVVSTCTFLERLQIALALWVLKLILLSLKNLKLHSKSCYLLLETGHENSLKLTIRSWELTEELGKNPKFLI